jgi:putative membrane protein
MIAALISALISLIVTAICLLIISRVPIIGVEIDSFGKAVTGAVVLGIVNAVLQFFATPFTFITFGLFAFVVNVIAFGLAAWLVPGFRLKNGILSALLGAIILMVLNGLIYQVIPN